MPNHITVIVESFVPITDVTDTFMAISEISESVGECDHRPVPTQG